MGAAQSQHMKDSYQPQSEEMQGKDCCDYEQPRASVIKQLKELKLQATKTPELVNLKTNSFARDREKKHSIPQ
jgi:hypothetical protein